MRQLSTYFIFLILLLCQSVLQARVVNSAEDLQRLKGFESHIGTLRDLERERLSNVDEVRKNRRAWEKQKADALKGYQIEKLQQRAHLDESSPAYRQDLAGRIAILKQHDQNRREHIQERDRRRQQQKSEIKLTEEHELGIDKDPIRVAWQNRRFFADSGKGGSGGSAMKSGRFSGSAGGSQGEAPPSEFVGSVPPPPPPDFFDSEPPPPPPPPMMENAFPGGFDDSIPPPVFDDPGPEF